jgi:hypothetical protein
VSPANASTASFLRPTQTTNWKRVLGDVRDDDGVNVRLERLMKELPHGGGYAKRRHNERFITAGTPAALSRLPRRRNHGIGAILTERITTSGIDLEILETAPPAVQLETLLASVEALRLRAIEAVEVWRAVGGSPDDLDLFHRAEEDGAARAAL